MMTKRNEKKRAFPKRGIIALLLVAEMLVGLFLSSDGVRAVGNESQAMLFGTYRANHEIEDGVLFIGTYLINKDAITDELYEQAQDSASEWGQQDLYYKSEFNNGNWFKISELGSFAEIGKSGTPAEDEEINALYVQYYMGSDGILIDVMTGEEKNPFDLIDPYDLSHLPELDPLRQQYTYNAELYDIDLKTYLTNHNSWDKKTLRADVYYYRIMNVFIHLNMRD